MHILPLATLSPEVKIRSDLRRVAYHQLFPNFSYVIHSGVGPSAESPLPSELYVPCIGPDLPHCDSATATGAADSQPAKRGVRYVGSVRKVLSQHRTARMKLSPQNLLRACRSESRCAIYFNQPNTRSMIWRAGDIWADQTTWATLAWVAIRVVQGDHGLHSVTIKQRRRASAS